MDPSKLEALLDRLETSMDASHKVNLDLIDLVRTLIREERTAVPPPAELPAPRKPTGRVYLDTIGAAEMIGISHKTMEKWRWQGGGPPYIKMGGGVRYDPSDLEEWVRTRRRRHTSDPGPGA